MKKLLVFLLVSLASLGLHAQDVMMYGDTTRVGVPYAKDPHVVWFKGRYLMYYSIPPTHWNGMEGWNIGIAESKDLVHWNRVGELTPEPGLEYERKGFCAPCALVKKGRVHLFYQTYGNGPKDAICHAVSKNGITFKRDKTNPIFHPEPSNWTCGRAIDAEVAYFKGKYYLYYATRDPEFKIQKMGVAVADGKTDFSRGEWSEACEKSILYPVLPWEKTCIEAPSVTVRGDVMYMFYAGAYNNEPQQIGLATSTDGINFERSGPVPFKRSGRPGEWNSSESGHPHVFTDRDGRTFLFYQGNPDHGKTWLISQEEVKWHEYTSHKKEQTAQSEYSLNNTPKEYPYLDSEKQRYKEESNIFVEYDEMPHYADGSKEDMQKFIEENIQWPGDPDDCIQGTVVISLDVDIDGNASNYNVARGLYHTFDEEALRVVKLIRWKRGKSQWKTVRMYVPVKYRVL